MDGVIALCFCKTYYVQEKLYILFVNKVLSNSFLNPLRETCKNILNSFSVTKASFHFLLGLMETGVFYLCDFIKVSSPLKTDGYCFSPLIE